jgi:hypothetical protein
MASLTTLPAEVLHIILSEVDPSDLASVSSVNTDLNNYINDNKLLFQEHYLRNWDKPRRLPHEPEEEPPWEEDVKRYIRLKKLLASSSYDIHRQELPFLCETVTDHLRCAEGTSEKSKNVAYLSEIFTDNHHYPLLTSSSLYSLAHPDGPGAANTFEERQLTAKLHCHYGVPITIDGDPTAVSPGLMHPWARGRVYDLRRYTEHTGWGPFLDDGSQNVDWEKVEAIMIVLHYNLTFVSVREGGQFPLPMWEKPFLGCTPHSYVEQVKPCLGDEDITQSQAALLSAIGLPSPISFSQKTTAALPAFLKEPSTKLEELDPFKITGTWMRVVCFLDYSELFQFNFQEDEEYRYTMEERPDLGELDTEEAVRMIIMRLRVTKVRPPKFMEEGEGDGEVDYKGMPVVEFIGSSHSLHSAWDPNANSMIRGMRGIPFLSLPLPP